MLITLKQKSVKVFKFYITTKFDSFLFNVRNVMIVFYFLCKLGFWPCLNMPERGRVLISDNKGPVYGLSCNIEFFIYFI